MTYMCCDQKTWTAYIESSSLTVKKQKMSINSLPSVTDGIRYKSPYLVNTSLWRLVWHMHVLDEHVLVIYLF